MTNFKDKVSAYNHVIEQLNVCTEEGNTASAAVLIFTESSDGENGTMRIYGLNMSEAMMPIALLEAVEKLRTDVVNRLINRTTQ
jgi:hypothetical protein